MARRLTDDHDGELNTLPDLVSPSFSGCERHFWFFALLVVIRRGRERVVGVSLSWSTWSRLKRTDELGSDFQTPSSHIPLSLFQPQPRPLQLSPLNAWSHVSWHYAGSRLVPLHLLVPLGFLLRERRLLLRSRQGRNFQNYPRQSFWLMELLLHPWSRSVAVWVSRGPLAVQPVRHFDSMHVTTSNFGLEYISSPFAVVRDRGQTQSTP